MTAEEYIELGFAYMKEKNWKSALGSLKEGEKRLLELSPDSVPPHVLSALGLCFAMAENRIEEGILYCRRAIDIEAFQAQFYYHLGMVYLQATNKKKAISTFYNGLHFNSNHSGIRNQLRRMGIRKRPVLSFLPRENFLNKLVGKFVGGKPTKQKTR